MMPDNILKIYSDLHRRTGKKPKFSIRSDELLEDYDDEDALIIKEVLEYNGFEFIEASSFHTGDSRDSYTLEMIYKGVNFNVFYEKEKSIDTEIERLENKLEELRREKAMNGEG